MEHVDRASRQADAERSHVDRGEKAPVKPVTCQPSLRIDVNKKEIKWEAGKPLPADTDGRGDTALLSPGPCKSKAGSGGTHRVGWLGSGGRQRAHTPAGKSRLGTRRPVAKLSGVAEAERGEAPLGQCSVAEVGGSKGGSLRALAPGKRGPSSG